MCFSHVTLHWLFCPQPLGYWPKVNRSNFSSNVVCYTFRWISTKFSVYLPHHHVPACCNTTTIFVPHLWGRGQKSNFTDFSPGLERFQQNLLYVSIICWDLAILQQFLFHVTRARSMGKKWNLSNKTWSLLSLHLHCYIALNKTLFSTKKYLYIFLTSRRKHMLWVLIRNASPRYF